MIFRTPRQIHPGIIGLALWAIVAGRLAGATPTLIWSDEFSQGDAADHTAPDSTKWTYELGNNGGWGNNELESYTSSRTNSYIAADPAATDGKALVIAAVKDSQGNYTSARLKTQYTFTTSYGHIESRLKTTSGKGLWPAFWMLGSSIGSGTPWPNCGEIDIMEVIGASPVTAYGTAHGPGYSGANGIGGSLTLSSGSYDASYHVFSVDWSPNQIVWAIDGTAYKTLTSAQIPSGTTWVFNNSPFFILLNLAVGGYWPGNPDGTTAFPAKYTIDYVRVYGIPPTAPAPGTASAATSAQVNLSWTAPSNLKGFTLTGYLIERATNANFSANLVPHSVGLVTSYADTTVAGGTTYYYRVSAVSSGGTSDPSGTLSATTPPSTTAPVFTLQPAANQVVLAGAGVSFSAAASGNPAPTYQWRKNSVNINGATGSSYGLALATVADAGTYTVVATNSVTSVTSTPAVLTVNPTSAGDFNGDSHPDLLWSDAATGERRIWLLNGTAAGSEVSLGVVPAEWVIGGAGDFNGDGLQDILWSNASTGERVLWLMNATGYASGVSLGVVPTDWAVAGVGDFNGDTHPDILWENTTTGEHVVWLMNGVTFGSSASLGGMPLNWTVSGVADFDRDGHLDILWTDAATGERLIWLLNGVVPTASASLGIVPADLQISAVGDYNGDGWPDLVMTNTATSERSIWLLNGATHVGTVSLGVVAPEWVLNRAARRPIQLAKLDFNGDGQPDLVWDNAVTGDHYVWLMSGPTAVGSAFLGTLPAQWRVAATADFDGDGRPDLVWENTATGERYLWLMHGPTFAGGAALWVVPPQWRIAEAGDFNGDGQPDLVWENTVTGEHYVWLMNGPIFVSSVALGTLPLAWRLATAGDFNGDGQPDLVWENTVTGEHYVWLMNGTTFAANVFLGTLPVEWRLATSGDFNGDGQTDLIWENTATGERYVWLMNGATFVSSAYLGTVSTDWSIRD